MSVHLRNAQDVPDLVQEVYLRMLRVSHQESICNPEAYLFTVAGHVVRQHSMRQDMAVPCIDIVHAQELPELSVAKGEDPAMRVENAQQVERFQKDILAKLPPRMGAALVLHRIHGYTIQETANKMGISRETAKQYLADAAARCRKMW
jgi:RNA polymerase sigma-19 factor, ECF subfamily